MAMNLFPAGIDDLFRGDHPFLQQPLQDLIGTALKILIRLLVEVTVFADKLDERFFIQGRSKTSKLIYNC